MKCDFCLIEKQDTIKVMTLLERKTRHICNSCLVKSRRDSLHLFKNLKEIINDFEKKYGIKL